MFTSFDPSELSLHIAHFSCIILNGPLRPCYMLLAKINKVCSLCHIIFTPLSTTVHYHLLHEHSPLIFISGCHQTIVFCTDEVLYTTSTPLNWARSTLFPTFARVFSSYSFPVRYSSPARLIIAHRGSFNFLINVTFLLTIFFVLFQSQHSRLKFWLSTKTTSTVSSKS